MGIIKDNETIYRRADGSGVKVNTKTKMIISDIPTTNYQSFHEAFPHKEEFFYKDENNQIQSQRIR